MIDSSGAAENFTAMNVIGRFLEKQITIELLISRLQKEKEPGATFSGFVRERTPISLTAS